VQERCGTGFLRPREPTQPATGQNGSPLLGSLVPPTRAAGSGQQGDRPLALRCDAIDGVDPLSHSLHTT
jgi:hypothetical protein